MRLDIYLDSETVRRLDALALTLGKSRSALIRQALSTLLDGQAPSGWPEIVRQFEGFTDWPAVENCRREQPPPLDDPLA